MNSLAAVAPLIIPLDPARTSVEGYITLNESNLGNELWWLKLTNLPPNGSRVASLAGAKLQVGEELARFIVGYETAIIARLKDSPSLETFFIELKTILSRIASLKPTAPLSRPASFYSTLRSELEGSGVWEKVCHLADDLSFVELTLLDAAGRSHKLKVTLPADYPAVAPQVVADLPVSFVLSSWPCNNTTVNFNGLQTVLQQFELAIASYQRIWDELDELDDKAWVVEPLNPSRSVLYRRIALGEHVTVGITTPALANNTKDDAFTWGSFPEFRFMGPDRSVGPLREMLATKGRSNWNSAASLYTNLVAVFGELPSKTTMNAAGEDLAAECAICYAYRLLPDTDATMQVDGGGNIINIQHEEEELGDVPDVHCENATCEKPFHRRCIVEWLAADPSTRQSFGTLFGTCPYCSAPMTVSTT